MLKKHIRIFLMGLISYRSPIYANMIARRTLGVGVGLLLISFFATSNAGMLSDIPQKLNKIDLNIKNIEHCSRYLFFFQENVLR